MMTLSPHDRTRIAAEGAVHVRTVARAYQGGTLKPSIRSRIEAAARKLGLELPPGAASGATEPTP